MHLEFMTIAVAICVGLIGLASLPAVSTFILQLTTREPKQDTYEDEDGKATPESVKAYSAKVPKFFILLFAVLGCATAIATGVLTTLHIGNDGLLLENWLSAGASVSYNLSPLWYNASSTASINTDLVDTI